MASDVFKALENIELAAFLPKVRSDLSGEYYFWIVWFYDEANTLQNSKLTRPHEKQAVRLGLRVAYKLMRTKMMWRMMRL